VGVTEKRRVAGVILHRGGRVLLQLRDARPDIPWPDTWAIFGGHLDPGEDPEDGAAREMAEELGLLLKPPLELVYHGEDEHRRRWIFAAPLEIDPGDLTLFEGQKMELVSEAQLDRLRIVPLHREILQGFFAGRRSG
jgi:8-oxo-dGTP diphosphatase